MIVELHLSLQNLLCRACFHDNTTSDWSYARLPSIDSDQQSQYSGTYTQTRFLLLRNSLVLCLQFPVRSGRPLTLEITLYDNVGRVFDNFTSLQWTWESSNQNALPTPQTSSLQHKDSESKQILIRVMHVCRGGYKCG